MDQLLKDQVAIVTGGNAGIGKAVAQKFASQGAKVIILGTNTERGEQTVKEIHDQIRPNAAFFYQVDVANTEQVLSVVKQILESFKQVDILVNNAGITDDQLLMKMSGSDWDRVMNVNVKSCYNLCHALIRPMMKARKGRIINMSSVIGLIGNAGQTSYAASKAAVIGFTKALAKEVASRNICVNCIAPGFISTNMTDVLNDSQKEEIYKQIPLGRMGKPEEIANATLFLASPLADYVTGQVIVVDGGMVM